MPESWEIFFSGDYLTFSEQILSPERTDFELEKLVEILNLTEGAKILDLGCGQGRISIPLCKKGFRVTCYDGSSTLLKEAKRRAQEAKVFPAFQLGKMKDLDYVNEFNAILNIGTAFGYVKSEEEDQKALINVNNALLPGGYFILETENRDSKIRYANTVKTFKMNETDVQCTRNFDSESGRWKERMAWVEENRRKEAFLDIRLYTATEIIKMIEKANLEVQEVYGGFDLSKLTIESPRLLITARKKI